jgi:hypothetical protein
MAIMLPGELDWILDILGYKWPNIDEDKLYECARAWRDFAQSAADAEEAGSSAAGAVTAVNSGAAIDEFSKTWGNFTGGVGHDSYLTDARLVAELIAGAFETAAIMVIAGKVEVIAQLITLATEIIAAQAAAPFTFGLSEVGTLGATQATRLIVRRVMDKMKQEMMDAIAKTTKEKVMTSVKKMAEDYVQKQVKAAVVDAAKDKATEFAKEAASNAAVQGIEYHFNARQHFDVSETVDIADKKATEYFQGIEDLKDPGKQAEKLTELPKDLLDEQKNKYGEQAGSFAQHHLDRLAGHGEAQTAADPEEEPAPTPPSPPRPAPNNNTGLQSDFG